MNKCLKVLHEACGSRETQSQVVNQQGIELIIAAMMLHETEEDVQEQCCQLLLKLSKDANNLDRIVDKGGMLTFTFTSVPWSRSHLILHPYQVWKWSAPQS